MYLDIVILASSTEAAPLQTTNPTPPIEKVANPLQIHQLGSPTPQLTLSSLQTIQPITARSPQAHYVFLTITSLSTTYTTTILLGNTFTTFSSAPQSAAPKVLVPEVPGIPTGTIVGIVVGCVVGFVALGVLFYGYVWRVKYHRARRRRCRGRSKSRSTGSSSGGSRGTEVC